MTTTLVLGGARSGKTRYAETLAQASGLAVTVIATARADDDEMRTRIAHHRTGRPADWRTVEEPLQLAACLRTHAAADRCLVVDCLTLWLSNLLCADHAALLGRERDALLEALPSLPGRLILVGNETGLGVVPLGALTRRYVDEAGRLHQTLAARCDRVVITIAGLPLTLKGDPA
jgi:adenosylcobinamide kinase / adenosylcobinamide-phosphate guanylyltransferase